MTDSSRAYESAVGACLGCARCVLERFCVIRWFSAGPTPVGRDAWRREPRGAKPAFDPQVFRARFALLHGGDQLTEADRARLEALFDAHPRLRTAMKIGRDRRISSADRPEALSRTADALGLDRLATAWMPLRRAAARSSG